MRQLVLAVSVALIAAVTAQSQSTEQSTQAAPSDNAVREKPAVKVQEMPDAPLRLSVETKWATPDQQMLEVYFKVTNVGSRPVRAYAVRVSHGVEAQQDGGCSLNDTEKAGKILQPNRSAGRSTWRPVPLSDTQTSIDLTLDFVEFSDGSTWGVDSCQSAERLSGLRAGAHAAKLRFKKKLDESGIDTLLAQLYANDPDLAPPEGHSDAWKAGFRGAINTLRERVRQANVEGGLPDVEAALQRPFDASENQ